MTTRRGKTIASVLGHDPAPAEPPAAEPQRLADSGLWSRQRAFYEQDVSGLWGTSLVPHGITANPSIAHTYARIAIELVRSTPAPAADEPLTVVELGGGSGRFAYLFVRALRELAPWLRFTYVLTDFSPDRVAGWAAHPSYASLVDEGLVDFAVLDADDLRETELVVSGRRLGPSTYAGPVLGIANYVFDTLRHEAYAVRDGLLLESRVVVADDGPTVEVAWETAPLDPTAHLPGDLAPILDHYRQVLDDTTVLVPTGALDCLAFLDDLTEGPSCALVADKGHATLLDLCSHEQPSVVPHGTGFSLMLNVDLLARHTRAHGGLAVLPPDPARHLVVAALVRGRIERPEVFEALARDHLGATGPDNAFVLRTRLAAATDGTIESMLAALRASRHDPTLLVELLPTLLDVLPTVPEQLRTEVERTLIRVWDHWFPIGEPYDLALCVGLALSALERHATAVDFLELAVKDHPDSAPAAFALGIARRGLRDLRVALTWAERALEIEPGFSQARALRAVLADELGEVG